MHRKSLFIFHFSATENVNVKACVYLCTNSNKQYSSFQKCLKSYELWALELTHQYTVVLCYPQSRTLICQFDCVPEVYAGDNRKTYIIPVGKIICDHLRNAAKPRENIESIFIFKMLYSGTTLCWFAYMTGHYLQSILTYSLFVTFSVFFLNDLCKKILSFPL